MKLRNAPLIRNIAAIGPDNRLFDALLLAGPLIILVIVVLGRNPVTLGLALGYLSALVGGILYAGLQRRR